MAIFHLTANVISRARGQSVIAAAAYRSGSRLRDERYGVVHDYTVKRGGGHAEILVPVGAPDWALSRESLWNRVEAAELRKDSQLARVIEVGLPVELTVQEALALVRDYTARTFVSKGMIADVSIRRDNPDNPVAHLLLTLRDIGPAGFGPKARRWNGKANLVEWRQAWAERANEHLARAGHAARIDHRTLEAQQIELTPARRVGAGLGREPRVDLPAHMTERLAEQQRIAHDNGAAILEDPTLALRALAHRSASFTAGDIERFLRGRTGGDEQFAAARAAVMASEDLVALRPAADGHPRFTSRDLVEAARSLRQRTVAMAARRGHGVSPAANADARSRCPLTETQRLAFDYVVGEGDIKALVLGDRTVLAASRMAWEGDGLRVTGVGRSRSSVEGLAASGIAGTLLETLETRWQQGSDLPSRATVVVADGAEMIDLKSLERLLAVIDKGRAKLVLIGDEDQLEAMTADSPFQDVMQQVGMPGVMNQP